MDVKKRLLRRPVTTAFWLLLVTAMALLFVVSFALYRSSGNLSGVLDDHHTTVAVRTDQATTSTAIEGGARWEITPHGLSQEDVAFLEGLPSVEGVYFHTLTGGYSPSLSPLMGIEQNLWSGLSDTSYMINESYDDVLAVVEVTTIFERSVMDTFDLTALGLGKEQPWSSITAEAKVVELVRGNEDYQNPDDEYVELALVALGQEAADLLQEGKRYLVLGQYNPEDIGGADPAYAHPDIRSDNTVLVHDGQLWCVGPMQGAQNDSSTIVYTTIESPFLAELEGSVEEFLRDPANQTWAEIAQSYDVAQHALPVMGTNALESMYLFVNNEATVTQGRAFTQEEYEEGARVCLLSESLAEKSGLQVGDSFCISQFLVHDFAENNYLIHNASTAHGAFNVDGMLNNPTVGHVDPDTEFVTENEVFTVIGLYRLLDEWADASYSITPNTIFIPRNAQIEGGFGGVEEPVTITDRDGFTYSIPNENGAHGVYLSVKLRNGRGSEFLEALEGTALMGTFIIQDQGYGAIQESINAVAQSAEEVFRVALLGWILILALYVLLYQGLQRKNLGFMRSLGAGVRQSRRYLLGSGFLLAALGVIIGTSVGAIVLDTIQDKVLLAPVTEAMMNTHSGGQALTTEELTQMLHSSGLSAARLILLGLIQLGIIGIVLWLHAALLARQSPRKLLRM